MSNLYRSVGNGLVITALLLALAHFVWGFIVIGVFVLSHHDIVPDFTWYYYAFHDVWFRHSAHLYDVGAQRSWIKHLGFRLDPTNKNLFAYPPFFAELFSVLNTLPFVPAFWVWNIMSALSYLGLLGLLGTWATRNIVHRAGLWAAGLVLYPAYENFYMGQVDIILALLIAAGLYCVYAVRAEWLGGLIIGIAASLKVTPGIFVIMWILTGRWRAVQGSICGLLGTVLSTLPAIPLDAYLYYVRHTLPQVNVVDFQYGGAPWNGSIKGILMSTRLRRIAPASAWVAGIGSVGALTAYLRRISAEKPPDSRLLGAALAGLMLIASPVVEIHTWVVAAIPLILTGGYVLDTFGQPLSVLLVAERTALLAAWLLFAIPDTLSVLPAVNGPTLVRQLIHAAFGIRIDGVVGYLPLPTGASGLGSILIAIQHMTALLCVMGVAVASGWTDSRHSTFGSAKNKRGGRDPSVVQG
jgi:hypothetical protein